MKRAVLSVGLALLVMALAAIRAVAAYYVWITVTESNGTSYTNLAMNTSIDVETLVDEGYIAANGTDTRVTDPDYNVLPHMLADDRVLWVGNLTGNATTQFVFWSEQSALSSFPTITGYGGYVTINDTADLEPGDIFMFQMIVDLDMTPTNGSLIHKQGACSLNRSGTNQLTFSVVGGNSLVASSVTSGYRTVVVYSDGTDMWIEVDDALKDTIATSSIPDTSNDWLLFQNDIAPAVYYYDLWIVTT